MDSRRQTVPIVSCGRPGPRFPDLRVWGHFNTQRDRLWGLCVLIFAVVGLKHN